MQRCKALSTGITTQSVQALIPTESQRLHFIWQ